MGDRARIDRPRDRKEPAQEPDRRPTAVVGIDGSPASRAALQWAIRYAQQTAATVHAVAVWHQPVQFGDDIPGPSPKFEAEAREWLADALPDPASEDPGAQVQAHTEDGNPATVLLEYAQRAELLVLGNHGRGALASVLIGSVAQRCA